MVKIRGTLVGVTRAAYLDRHAGEMQKPTKSPLKRKAFPLSLAALTEQRLRDRWLIQNLNDNEVMVTGLRTAVTSRSHYFIARLPVKVRPSFQRAYGSEQVMHTLS